MAELHLAAVQLPDLEEWFEYDSAARDTGTGPDTTDPRPWGGWGSEEEALARRDRWIRRYPRLAGLDAEIAPRFLEQALGEYDFYLSVWEPYSLEDTREPAPLCRTGVALVNAGLPQPAVQARLGDAQPGRDLADGLLSQAGQFDGAAAELGRI